MSGAVGRRTRRGLLAVVSSLAVAAVTTGCGRAPERPDAYGPAGRDATRVEVTYAIDPSDERELASFGENVFVGRVLGRARTVSAATSAPQTPVSLTVFDVAVKRNIKGRLKGVVRVAQYGRDTYTGAAKRARGGGAAVGERWQGDPLLRAGEEVLFVTRRNARSGWHTIVAQPYADRRLRTPAERSRLMRVFTDAAKTPRAKDRSRPASP